MNTDDLKFQIRKTVAKDMNWSMEGQMRAKSRPDIHYVITQKCKCKLGMVGQTCNCSTWKTEVEIHCHCLLWLKNDERKNEKKRKKTE